MRLEASVIVMHSFVTAEGIRVTAECARGAGADRHASVPCGARVTACRYRKSVIWGNVVGRQKETCLPMNLRQFQEAVWHWRGMGCGPSEPGYDSGEVISAVEAILEFGEVSWHVLAADGTVSTGDGRFDVPESRVDPFECWGAGCCC